MKGFNDKPPITRVKRSKDEARAAYDRMSRWYDLMAGASEQPHVRDGLDKLAAQEGQRVLEIGFGTGHALVSLARAVGGSGQVYGVDISQGMAQQARKALEKVGVEDEASLILGDGQQLPLRDRSMDGIFMSFTLELFDTPNMPRVLAECQRVLKAEGQLCVVSLAKRGTGSLSVRLYEWVHNQLPRYVDCRPIPLESVLENGGFEIVDVERGSMWTLPVDVALGRLGSD